MHANSPSRGRPKLIPPSKLITMLLLLLLLLLLAAAAPAAAGGQQHRRPLLRAGPRSKGSYHPAVNATHAARAAAAPGQACHPECHIRGNCNAEEGRCECPYGYAGPACQDALLPACRLADGPLLGAIVSCSEQGPVSCECHRQCRRLQCGLLNEGTGKCALQRTAEPACWEFAGRPAYLQLSSVPAEHDASVVGPLVLGLDLQLITTCTRTCT
jgi:hypothetical protein